MVRSTTPGSKVPRTNAINRRSSQPSRFSPSATRSGRSLRRASITLPAPVASAIFEDDVEVARRGNSIAERPDDLLREGSSVRLGNDAEPERQVRFEIPLRVERTKQAVTRHDRKLRD